MKSATVGTVCALPDNQGYVQLLSHSISQYEDPALTGQEAVSLRLRYPRLIHGEFMTHKMISKNAASSRAIKASKAILHALQNPARPVEWGMDNPGMQSRKLHPHAWLGKAIWKAHAYASIAATYLLQKFKFHKQIANRVNETHSLIDVVMSATDMQNFFWLRYHPDADPTIRELAKAMFTVYHASNPMAIKPGEWHLPYIYRVRDDQGVLHYHKLNITGTYDCGAEVFEIGEEVDLETAREISASCAAQASFRNLDFSNKKASNIKARLIDSEPKHASPFEHPATPMPEWEWKERNQLYEIIKDAWIDPERILYCANFRGWIQWRKLIPQENLSHGFSPEVFNNTER